MRDYFSQVQYAIMYFKNYIYSQPILTQFFMDYVINIIIGLVTSIIGSFIFLRIVLNHYKPKIIQSPFIVRKKDFGSNDMCHYFKFVNKSTYPAYDVKIELYKLERIPTGQGKQDERKTNLSLVVDYISQVPENPRKKDSLYALHAVVVRSKDDVMSILKNDTQSVALKIMLRHGLSGLVKVFTMEYANTTMIKEGGFQHGDNTDAF